MLRVFGWKSWVFVGFLYGGIPPCGQFAGFWFPGLAQYWPSPQTWLVYVPPVLAVIALILAWKPVWRMVWWAVPPLREHFPDLNGTWDMRLQSNFSRIEKMKDAAMDANPKRVPFDRGAMPAVPLSVHTLTAVIDQRWLGVTMKVEAARTKDGVPVVDDSRAPIINRSRTLSFDIIPASGSKPAELAYIYEQINKADKIDLRTDGPEFLGAAFLKVIDENTLEGAYMTGREWVKGLNAAGFVTLTRRQERHSPAAEADVAIGGF